MIPEDLGGGKTLAVPIRKTYRSSRGDNEEEEEGGGMEVSSEPPIGVVQCINKLGATMQTSEGEPH